MKNILIITTVSGFLQKFESENVRLLKETGYNVIYCAGDSYPAYLYEDGCYEKMGVDFCPVSIDKSPFHIKNNFKAFKELEEIVRKENIAAIHCHTPVGGLLGRLLGKKYGLKVIYTAHGFHFYKGAGAFNNLVYGGIERWLAGYTDAVVVINSEDFEAACAFKLKKGGRVYKIPGVGLDTEKFRPVSDEERKKARKQAGISDDEFLLVSVGELNKNKNHETVIRALKLLGEENVRCVVCGDGPKRKALENLIMEPDLKKKAALLGYVQDVREILAAADAFVFPSIREGLGMAALEAMAMGIPVIAADNRGSREYMKDGINGYVCPGNSKEEYAAAVRKIMKLSKEELAQMKDACRKTSQAFSKDAAGKIMKEVYSNHL